MLVRADEKVFPATDFDLISANDSAVAEIGAALTRASKPLPLAVKRLAHFILDSQDATGAPDT